MTDDEYKLIVEEYNVGALWARPTVSTWTQRTPRTRFLRCLATTSLPWSSTPPTASTTTRSTRRGTHLASTLRSSDSSQIWNTTATPPSVLKDLQQVWPAQKIRLWFRMLLFPSVSAYFQTGGTGLNVNTLTGASWYVLNTAANALPTDGRWLIAQITTTGSISGTLNYQIFPLGDGANQIQKSVDFDGPW